MGTKEYTLNQNKINEVLTDIALDLRTFRLNESLIKETSLLCEEILLKFAEKLNGKKYTAGVSKSLGGVVIKFRVPGCLISLEPDGELDPGAAIISRFGDRVSLRYHNGINYVTVSASQPYAAIATFSALAFLVAIPVGFAIRGIFPEYSDDISYMLYSIEEMFSKAMEIIATPITFFSLFLVIARNFNIFENRGYYRGVLMRYITSSFAAAIVGYAVAKIQIGIYNSLTSNIDTSLYIADADKVGDITKVKYLLDLVPDSVLVMFEGGNLGQILFFAVLCGFAVGSMGYKNDRIIDASDMLSNIFCRMLSMLAMLFPPMTFAAVLDIVISNDYPLKSLDILAVNFSTIAISVVIMCLIYALTLIFNRVNPIKFFKNTSKPIREIAHIGSTLDSVPYTIRVCHRNLGIPIDFLDFTIPLGANINMDGNCISLMVVSMMMISYSGLEITLGGMALLLIAIVLLSIGAPNQPGSTIICFAVLFPFLGLSTQNIPVVIIIDSIAGMGIAAFNVIGDMVTATIMAKRSGLIKNIPDKK